MFRLSSLIRQPCSSLTEGCLKTSSAASAVLQTPGQTGGRSPHPQTCWSRGRRQPLSLGVPRLRRAAERRGDLCRQRRVVVKLGSAVITREDECGLALGRLASIVEQVAELQKQGREVILVTSGAVAFGKQRLREESLMSMSMRQNLTHLASDQAAVPRYLEPRACAAVGQNGLMFMYDAMFQQYGFKTAQVLVNKKDFEKECSGGQLKSTLASLCAFHTIPIINTNDAIAPPPQPDQDLAGVISIKDNDSLAARLAVDVGAGLLIIMSDVNGLYTAPPGSPDARLLSTYCPTSPDGPSVTIGDKSRVGLGGMDSKVKAAAWALKQGTSVVICNGCEDRALVNIVRGKKVGTFFTTAASRTVPVEVQARQAREGSVTVQALTGEERVAIVHRLADLLLEHKASVTSANQLDLDGARHRGMSESAMSKLRLSEEQVKTAAGELRQTAARFSQVQGQVVRRTRLASSLEVRQVTVPIGVLLAVMEAHPEALLQMAALSICSGNGLLVKGGQEMCNTNTMLHSLVQEALQPFASPHTVALVSQEEDIADLLTMHRDIDLVIPWGSSALVRHIQDLSHHIPVLGHREGVCHVYIDEDADPQMALRVVLDSKCQNPAASNTMETLLVHRTHRQGPLFDHICEQLRNKDVDYKAGPKLSKLLKFNASPCKSLKTEYGRLECTIEVVDDVEEAIDHINAHGSGHTDSIVTNNQNNAEQFLRLVDSACVFHNTSTRLSDGYIFGLGTQVGINTARVHARGPVGMEGLLTTKWILQGGGQVMGDVADGALHLDHHTLPTQPGDHHTLPTQPGDHHTLPTQPGDHHTLPTQPGDHHTLPTQPGDHHTLLTQPGDHHTLPTQPGDHHTLPTQPGDHHTLPTQPGDHHTLPTESDDVPESSNDSSCQKAESV